MPTIDEYTELLDNCTWTWITQNGVEGYLVTSNKTGYADKSIFLPAARSYSGKSLYYGISSYGSYWSSSLEASGMVDLARSLEFDTWSHVTGYQVRSYGYSVRPVCPQQNPDNKGNVKLCVDKEITIPIMTKIERTFWPVGQGAFYSELFYDEGKPNGLVVYDCGTLSSQKYIKSSIKELRQKFDNSSICENGGINIDILFVSHFHYDHISGITQLLKVFNIKKIVLPVIPQEAYADVYFNNYINERHEGKPTIELLEKFLSDDNNINNTQLL